MCAVGALAFLHNAPNRPVNRQAAAPSQTLTPTPAPTIAPTPSPKPTPTPTPDGSHLLDGEPWYQQRNSDLRAMLKRNGTFHSEQEIDDAVAGMSIDPTKPMVALTFDDGPVKGVTDEILDILAQYNVRATFFIVGWRLQKPEAVEMVRRAIAQGCEIGNHTYAHDNMTKQNVVSMKWALSETNHLVFEQTGYVIRDMRPPGGSTDYTVMSLSGGMGMAVVLWAQSGNVMETVPEKIAQNVQKQIVNGKELHDGDIILLHDTKKHMVDAVKIIVPQLIGEGYQLVTVWELLNLSEAGFVPGQIYRHQ